MAETKSAESFTSGIEMYDKIEEGDEIVIFSTGEDNEEIDRGEVLKNIYGIVVLENEKQQFAIHPEGDLIRFVGDEEGEEFGDLEVVVNSGE